MPAPRTKRLAMTANSKDTDKPVPATKMEKKKVVVEQSHSFKILFLKKKFIFKKP
jgi:hypothetical protein